MQSHEHLCDLLWDKSKTVVIYDRLNDDFCFFIRFSAMRNPVVEDCNGDEIEIHEDLMPQFNYMVVK